MADRQLHEIMEKSCEFLAGIRLVSPTSPLLNVANNIKLQIMHVFNIQCTSTVHVNLFTLNNNYININ